MQDMAQYHDVIDWLSKGVVGRTNNISDPEEVEKTVDFYVKELRGDLLRKVKERIKKLKAMRKLQKEGKGMYEVDDEVRVKLHSTSKYAGYVGVVTHKERDRVLTRKEWMYTLSVYCTGEPIDGIKFWERDLEAAK